MSEELKKFPRKTEAELVEADPDTLTNDELDRRIKMAQLRKSEREIFAVEAENEKHKDLLEEKKRKQAIRTEVIKQNEFTQNALKNTCKHKTGGKDKQGMFNGDGSKYGYSVNDQTLPNGVRYRICTRCQKEWFPTKYMIYLGRIDRKDKAARDKNTREYMEAMGWATVNTPVESVLFRIPRFEKAMDAIDEADAKDAAASK